MSFIGLYLDEDGVIIEMLLLLVKTLIRSSLGLQNLVDPYNCECI